MTNTTVTLDDKGKNYSAKISYYDAQGTRRFKRVSLKLPVKPGNLKEAKRMLKEVADEYLTSESFLSALKSDEERMSDRIMNLPLTKFLQWAVDQRKVRVDRITYNKYCELINGRIRKYFEPRGTTAKELTGDMINEFIGTLFDDDLSSTTAIKYHQVIHLGYQQAIKMGYTEFNPTTRAERPKLIRRPMDYFNEYEAKQLLDSLGDDPLRVVIYLAIYCGMRKSEILGLRWQSIDFQRKTITVENKVVKEADEHGKEKAVAKESFKTESSYRSIMIFDDLLEELEKKKTLDEEMRRVLPKSYNHKWDDYVCVDVTGKLFDPDYVTSHFHVLLKRAGLRKIRFHELRHSCASILIAQGIDIKLIQALLGHSTVATTADIYGHIDARSKQLCVDTIGNTLRNATAE